MRDSCRAPPATAFLGGIADLVPPRVVQRGLKVSFERIGSHAAHRPEQALPCAVGIRATDDQRIAVDVEVPHHEDLFVRLITVQRLDRLPDLSQPTVCLGIASLPTKRGRGDMLLILPTHRLFDLS